MLPTEPFGDKEKITNALYGSWASWSLPGSLDNCNHSVEGCCLGAGIRGCFLVWDDVSPNRMAVNMGFSRNSEWVEVIGYEPYSGQWDIRIYNAPVLHLKVPGRVSECSISLDGQSNNGRRNSKGYLEFKEPLFFK